MCIDLGALAIKSGRRSLNGRPAGRRRAGSENPAWVLFLTGRPHMVPEHCPISILQAHGGDAIPGLALWTTERFVAVLSELAVELPATSPRAM